MSARDDRREQLRKPDRLLEEIERADLRRLDGCLDRAMTGHHHDGHRQLAGGAPFAQQRNAVGVRHPDIEQHERRLHPQPIRARLAGVLGERDPVALVLQDLGEELANADFVVDDQDVLAGVMICVILRRRRRARKGKRDARAAREVVERDPAAMLVDDFLHDRRPSRFPSPLSSHTARRRAAALRGNPSPPSVTEAAPRRRRLERDRVARHRRGGLGVDGVLQEIVKHLAETGGLALDDHRGVREGERRVRAQIVVQSEHVEQEGQRSTGCIVPGRGVRA